MVVVGLELIRKLIGIGLVVDHQAFEIAVADDAGQLQHVQLFRQAPDCFGAGVVEV